MPLAYIRLYAAISQSAVEFPKETIVFINKGYNVVHTYILLLFKSILTIL